MKPDTTTPEQENELVVANEPNGLGASFRDRTFTIDSNIHQLDDGEQN
jgi:hypothetical protein